MDAIKTSQAIASAHPEITVECLSDGLHSRVRESIVRLPGAGSIRESKVVHAKTIQPVDVGTNLPFIIKLGGTVHIATNDNKTAVLVSTYSRIWLNRPDHSAEGRPIPRGSRLHLPAMTKVSRSLTLNRDHFQVTIGVFSHSYALLDPSAETGPKRPLGSVCGIELVDMINRIATRIDSKTSKRPSTFFSITTWPILGSTCRAAPAVKFIVQSSPTNSIRHFVRRASRMWDT
ncbi:MAG: hypothetical protein JWQ71_4271 [Pedosphaera sp.]|nr:hypothetical protein [Pedosphaera sp.]